MKKIIFSALMLFAGIYSAPAFAEAGKGSIGFASKSIVIESGTALTYTWSGLALVGEYAFTDYIALHGTYYTLVETADANSEMKGFDADIRFGPNGMGFTYYGSLGYFGDTWNGSTTALTQDYSGTSFGFGIGYNWEHINLDWNIFTIRSNADYPGGVDFVGTGALGLSYRF